jgi:hypothetical protein
MANNRDNKIVHIDPIYIKYRKMWKENRWQFSGDLVKLTIKQNKVGLDNIEKHAMDTMNRVINENDGKWTEGYEYDNGILSKIKNNRDKKK